MGRNQCPECSDTYPRLGKHWFHNPEHRPSITSTQEDLITGLLMGDAWIQRCNKYPFISVELIEKDYLLYLQDQFGPLSGSVSLRRTAEESATNSMIFGSTDPDNYSDVYRWQTRTHPGFERFDWYQSSSKVWPEDLDLTPTVLKTWYVCDGNYYNSGSDSYIRISMSNEIMNTDKIDRYFSQAGVPTPSKYDISTRKRGGQRCSARFTVDDSDVLFEYMGSPPPSFSYKWPSYMSQ